MATPWLTRSEAAEHLCCSVETVDRNSVLLSDHPSDAPEGKMRYVLINLGPLKRVRVVAEDVYRILPKEVA